MKGMLYLKMALYWVVISLGSARIIIIIDATSSRIPVFIFNKKEHIKNFSIFLEINQDWKSF